MAYLDPSPAARAAAAINAAGGRPAPRHPAFSLFSIGAAIAAALALFTEGFDLLLGIAAVGLGLVGGLFALLPQWRGGVVSIVAVVLGAFAILSSVFQTVFRIF